jgi:VWFA-related protein
MKILRWRNWLFVAALCWLGTIIGIATAIPANAQQAAPPPQQAPPAAQASTSQPPGPVAVIKQETKVVLADVVVTDKKGNYVHDLEARDFRVSEDNKPQTITTFLTGSNISPNAPDQKRYLVLFFDNASMDMSDQARARQAAMQFIDQIASSDRLMAVVDYGGVLQIAQNFTANADRLKKVVQGAKFAVVAPNEAPEDNPIASTGTPPVLSAEQDFAVRSVLLALRRLAKSLATVPGRKTLILFTSGFRVTVDNEAELTATIDACNKANVAIYPLDVRGLVAFQPRLGPSLRDGGQATRFAGNHGYSFDQNRWSNGGASFQLAAYALPDPQKGGGGGGGGKGGGGGGGKGGGGSGGGGGHGGPIGSGPGVPGIPANFNNALINQPRLIVPQFPQSAAPNQQVLYTLAAGTGGFVILNTNDFLAGLNKIARELNEYYLLGYTPANPSPEGSCHTIQVKVEQKGLHVRARSGYCSVPAPDPLLGKPEGAALEARAASAQPGSVQVSLQTPFFYTAPNQARVNLALECPSESFHFAKEKGKYASSVNVLGIAYRQDGSVAARFSDEVKLDLEKDEMKEFERQPFQYQNTFDVAPGNYTLKVVMSLGGETFGKYETPLQIEPNEGKPFTLSALVISDQIHAVSDLSMAMDSALLEDRTPLVADGMQVVPSATNQFDHKKKIGLYFEIYDAKLADANPPRVAMRYLLVDRKTNQAVFDSATSWINSMAQKGSPLIPVGLWLAVEKIPPGQYTLVVGASDNVGNWAPTRRLNFELR